MIADMNVIAEAASALREDEIARLVAWIVAAGLRGAEPAELLETTAETLRASGIPLLRGFLGFRTLHPLHSGYGFVWRRGGVAVDEATFRRQAEPIPSYLESPLHYMISRGLEELRVRLDEPGALDFPIFAELRGEGATGYFARAIAFREGRVLDEANQGVIFTWTTERPGGFVDPEIAAFERILPILGLAVRSASTQHLAETVLCTYIGHDAGRRVLRGEIDRGAVRRQRAVLLFEDLRGFTAHADVVAPEDLVRALNGYLDAMGRPLLERGGEILKFMGDGILGVIGLDGDSDAGCRAALQAARETRAAVDGLNRARRAAGEIVMELDIVLHVGEMMYGNVGAVGRLDFTMIGPVVNEAARMEPLCRALGRTVLASEAFFASCAADGRRELVSVGRHALRDIAGERELFTLRNGD